MRGSPSARARLWLPGHDNCRGHDAGEDEAWAEVKNTMLRVWSGWGCIIERMQAWSGACRAGKTGCTVQLDGVPNLYSWGRMESGRSVRKNWRTDMME